MMADKTPLGSMVEEVNNRGNVPMSSMAAKMAAKLQGAHFRMLNEELYTTSSNKAVKLFGDQPELFDQYHAGFRQQVHSWPQNPVDLIASQIRKNPKWVVADMGCGDAKLAATLSNKVHSFDLVAKNDRVTACDIAHVPLENDTIDAVVFSLALMGTNYADFLVEGARILKMKGRMFIAEVRSRVEAVLEEFLSTLQAMGLSIDKVEKENKMFVMVHLTKTGKCPKSYAAVSKPPPLKACQYKKR